MNSRLSFCVIIPMYNEEANAEHCVGAVCRVLDSLPYRTALIVVDDGSTDATRDILKRLGPEHSKLVVLTHERNAGYGSALRSGIKKAVTDGFDYALFMDSDLTNDPNDIPRFVAKMLEAYDMIKASRYCKGGAVVGVPAYRVIISVIGNRVARFLYRLPLTDCTNGFRAVKVSFLSKITLTEPAFSIIMEELYYAKFLAKSFCEIPVVLTTRTEEQRPTTFGYPLTVFYRYFKYAIKSFLHIKPLRLEAASNS